MNESNAPQTCPVIFYLRTVCVIKFTRFEALLLVGEKKKTFFLCSPHEHILCEFILVTTKRDA